MNLLSKITFKAVGADSIERKVVPVYDEATGTTKDKQVVIASTLMRLAGIASKDVKVLESEKYGDSIEFHGEFTAINIKTGEVYNAPKAFLPRIAESYLLGVVSGIEDGEKVEFGFDIGVKPTNSIVGYEYTVTPLVEQKHETNSMRLLNELTVKKPLQVLIGSTLVKTEETEEPDDALQNPVQASSKPSKKEK